MDIQKALKTLEEIENRSADLFGWLSEAFAADEKASMLFARLHLWKRSHANLLQYQSRILLKNSRTVQGAIAMDPEHARALLEDIERFRGAAPDLPEAVRTALAFGNAIERIYQDPSFLESLNGLGAFVAQLRKGCQDHGAALRSLAAERGIPDAPPAISHAAAHGGAPATA